MSIMDAIEAAGYVIDTPRALTHGLAAKIGDAVRGKKVRDNWRASGREMLESLGVLDKNQEGLDAGDVAGLGAEMFLDPANLVGAGLLAKFAMGSKASKLSKAVLPKAIKDAPSFAGIADQVPNVAGGRKLVNPVGTPAINTLMGNAPAQPTMSPEVVRQMMMGDPVGKLREISARTPFEAQVIPELPKAVQPGIAQAMSAMAPKKQPWVRPDLPPDATSKFYSRLERAVEALPGKQIKAQSVMNQIKKYPEGVSQDEIDWTDVAGFLKGKDTVSKDDLVAYVKANRPKIEQLEDVNNYQDTYSPYIQGKQYADDFTRKTYDKNVATHDLKMLGLKNPKLKKISLADAGDGIMSTHNGEGVVERGNMDEVLTHLFSLRSGKIDPVTPTEKAFMATNMTSGEFAKILKDPMMAMGGDSNKSHIVDGLSEAESYLTESLGGYKSHNFPEAKNPLLHTRSTTRKTPLGKMLLGEEQQSDWLQDASKYGFYDEPLAKPKWTESIDDGKTHYDSQYGVAKTSGPMSHQTSISMHPPFDEVPDYYKMGFNNVDEAKQFIIDNAEANKHVRPPRAPMRDTWADLALKQHLVDAAADPDVKYIGLPSGEDVQRVVGGELAGQQQFYNQDQIKRMNGLLSRFGVTMDPVSTVAEKIAPKADIDAGRIERLGELMRNDASSMKSGRAEDLIERLAKRYGVGPAGVVLATNAGWGKDKIARALKGSASKYFQPRYGAANLAPITKKMRNEINTKGLPLMSALAAALLGPSLMDREGQ